MEYALEGHGYSVERILRARWAEPRAGADMAGFHSLGEAMLDSQDLAFGKPPGLLSTLKPLLPGGPMNGLAFRVATGTKVVFDKLGQDLPLRLTQCSLETGQRGNGHMFLGVHCPTLTADVRVDDAVAAGVLIALRGEPVRGYRLEVVPRVYRKICRNGMVVLCGDATARAIDPVLLVDAEEQESLTWAIEQATRACLDPTVFDAAVERCRQSAAERLGPSGGRLADALDALLGFEMAETVRHRYVSEGDFTRWGMVNAMTAEARTAPSELMFELEHLGGVLAEAVAAFHALAHGARRMVVGVRSWYDGPGLPDDDGPSVDLDDFDDLADRFAALERQK